jgi:flavin-dependent dehydrogenase
MRAAPNGAGQALAAAEAGAEVRAAFTVTGLISSADRLTGVRGRPRGGAEIAEQARIVIGADGRNSLVAKAVGAAEYNARPVLTCACYAYWRDVTPDVPAIHPRTRRVVISFPTNDGLTVTPAVFPRDELPAVRASLERHLSDALGLVGDFAEPFRRSARVERIRAMGDLPNFFRKPYGDGWALVGDAGYHKDPILAPGICDAFRSSEWVADAVHAGFSGARPLEEAMAEYQRVRDEHFAPTDDLTCGMTALEPVRPDMLALYQALRHNLVERDRYFGTLGGTVPIPEFYAPENVRRIISAASV